MANTTGTSTSALERTLLTMTLKADPSECLERDRPRPECDGRLRAKSTVSMTESIRCSAIIGFRDCEATQKEEATYQLWDE